MPVVVRYGVVGGLILGFLFFVPAGIIGARPEWLRISEIIGYSTMILCMSSTFLAMRAEQRSRGGSLGFSSALGVGVGVTLIASLLFGLFTWLFFVIRGDGAAQMMLDHYTNEILQSGLPQAEIDVQLAELASMKGLFFDGRFHAVVMFATVFVIGTVESALGALILRSTRSTSATRTTATAS